MIVDAFRRIGWHLNENGVKFFLIAYQSVVVCMLNNLLSTTDYANQIRNQIITNRICSKWLTDSSKFKSYGKLILLSLLNFSTSQFFCSEYLKEIFFACKTLNLVTKWNLQIITNFMTIYSKKQKTRSSDV